MKYLVFHSLVLVLLTVHPQIVFGDQPGQLTSASTGGNFEFTGQVAFETVDRDSNGLAEDLAMNAEFRVLEAGKYVIKGVLSHHGNFISHSPRFGSPRFSSYFFDGAPGTYVARLEFSGEDIFEHGQNGPYEVTLWAIGPSGVEDTLEFSTPYLRLHSFWGAHGIAHFYD